jgi:glycosyltransferase involved in cell wall biosynthesis
VSVVIPTYRHRDYVAAALASVEAQTFRDFEIVVVNDGSPDDTEAVLRPWIDRGAIRYVAQENRGQAAARNRGIELARGEFVALLDDDDLWLPDKLAWQVEYLRGNRDCGLVAGAAEVMDESGMALRSTPDLGDVGFERLLEGNCLLSPGQALVRRSALDRAGGFDPAVWGADDWDLWLRIALADRVRITGRVSLRYRKHAANASADMGRMLRNCLSVVERNVGRADASRRRRLRRDAHRYVFGYAGTRLIASAAHDFAAWRIGTGLSKLAELRRMLPHALRDPRLLRMIAGALVRGRRAAD